MSEDINVAMIAAVGSNLELGIRGDLVWHISSDLKRFKQLTMGHPVIMGRKTWESLPKRPLPGRLNVVLSRSMVPVDGIVVASSIDKALEACEGEKMPFIIGGADIYREFLPRAAKLFITSVDAHAPNGVDAWFPEFRNDWRLEDASEWMIAADDVKYRFETWVRI